MKVHIEVEEKDILNAIEVHRNGDAFRIYRRPEYPEPFIGYGSYCLVNLIQGFEFHLHKLLEENNGNPIPLSDLIKLTPEFLLKLAEHGLANAWRDER